MDSMYKLKLANNLQDEIENINSFISIVNKIINPGREGLNLFRHLEVSADICTGSQSPNYKATIYSHELIEIILNGGVLGLEAIKKKKQKELEDLFVKD